MTGHRMIAGLLLIGALTACGGGDDEGDDPVDQGTFGAGAVCEGTGWEAAPAVGSGTEQLGFYVHDEDGWALDSWSAELPENAEALIPEEASIIVCLSVVETGASVSCPFEDEGDEFTLVVAEATFDVAIRAAATGETLAQGPATSGTAECPLAAFWTQGEGTRTDYAKPVDDVLALLEPYLA